MVTAVVEMPPKDEAGRETVVAVGVHAKPRC